jgi:peptidyl-prolyl cis-trans isomerase C
LIIALPALAAAAEVKNLKVVQEGDKAVATYELVATAGEQEAEVTVAIIVDGKRRTSDQLKLTGDLGKNVKVGPVKRIVWNAMADLPPDFEGELNWDVTTVRVRDLAGGGSVSNISGLSSGNSPDTDIMAIVNGTKIPRSDVKRATTALLAQSKAPQDLAPELKKQAEEAALEQLINTELLYQAGMKLELKDLDKKVADKLALGKARFPSTTEYEATLKSNNITEKELQDIIRKDIIINNLYEKTIIPKVDVQAAEIKKFYDDNQDKFKMPESYHASHILIGVDPNAKPEEKAMAKEKAEVIRKRILNGEDFAALAKAESTCPSKDKGGDLGTFGKGEMVPAFEKATAALKPGELSEVVETQFGYHIIKLIEKKDGGTVKFDEVKEKIANYLKQIKTQKVSMEYIGELRKTAKIEKPGVK